MAAPEWRVMPIQKNNLISLPRLAVLVVLSQASALLACFFEWVLLLSFLNIAYLAGRLKAAWRTSCIGATISASFRRPEVYEFAHHFGVVAPRFAPV
jgi:hypothetical protein